MSSIEDEHFLETLRNEAKLSQPGILPKNTKFDSYIGHVVINISDTVFDQNQIRALEKGLAFCPSLGPPDKSQIGLDFKEFHRRLELMEFFGRDTKESNELNINQSIIDFMNNNGEADPTENELEDGLKEIQQKFRPKSGWETKPAK